MTSRRGKYIYQFTAPIFRTEKLVGVGSGNAEETTNSQAVATRLLSLSQR